MRQQRMSPARRDSRFAACSGSRSEPFSCKVILTIVAFLPIRMLTHLRFCLSGQAMCRCRTKGNIGDSMGIIGTKAVQMELKHVEFGGIHLIFENFDGNGKNL